MLYLKEIYDGRSKSKFVINLGIINC